jgi:hypothetical protein
MKSNKYLILEEIKYSYIYSILSVVVWVIVLLWAIFHDYKFFYDWSWKEQSLLARLFFFCTATIFIYMGIKWIRAHNIIEQKKKNWNKKSARVTDIWETEYRSTKFTKLTFHDYDSDDTYYTTTFIDVSKILRHWDLVDIYINPENEDDYYVDLNAAFKEYAIKNKWIKKNS